MKETLKVNNKAHKPRFWELDFLRGFCVVLMVFDHIMFSLSYIAPSIDEMLGSNVWINGPLIADGYLDSDLRTYFRFIVLFAFFFLCGVSCTLSRSNFKRGGLCFLVGCGITFFTVVASKIMNVSIEIYFGVLQMLGASILLYAVLMKAGEAIPKLFRGNAASVAKTVGDYLAPTVGLILLIVYFGFLCTGVRGDMFATDVYIKDNSMSVLASIFIRPNEYSAVLGGADMWTMLPWCGMVLLGGYAGIAIYRSNKRYYLAKYDGKWNRGFCFVGRHALIVYVLHQVVVFVILFLITLIAA